MTGLGPCQSNNGCAIDAISGSVAGAPSCPKLNYSSAFGEYSCAPGDPPSIYNRVTTITLTGDEAKVVVIVSWPEQTYTRTLTLESRFFNWK